MSGSIQEIPTTNDRIEVRGLGIRRQVALLAIFRFANFPVKVAAQSTQQYKGRRHHEQNAPIISSSNTGMGGIVMQ